MFQQKRKQTQQTCWLRFDFYKQFNSTLAEKVNNSTCLIVHQQTNQSSEKFYTAFLDTYDDDLPWGFQIVQQYTQKNQNPDKIRLKTLQEIVI